MQKSNITLECRKSYFGIHGNSIFKTPVAFKQKEDGPICDS